MASFALIKMPVGVHIWLGRGRQREERLLCSSSVGVALGADPPLWARELLQLQSLLT